MSPPASATPPSTVLPEAAFDLATREVSAVSFDAFDTLVERPLERPADAFEFFAPRAAAILGFRSLDYRSERVSAEESARAVLGATLDPGTRAIAEALATRLGVEPAIAAAVLDAETAFERTLLRARPAGRALFERARAAGFPIFIVSDTRFDAGTLRSILEGCGYDGISAVLTSSDRGASKRDGRLFAHLLDTARAPAERVLHVGDHAAYDVARAREAGLAALHLPRVELAYFESAGFERIFGRHGERLDAGTRARLTVAARHLGDRAPTDDSQFGGDPRTLGYLGLGPLLLGFARFVLDSAIADRRAHLHFLSRDGRVVLEAYRILAAERPDAPAASYLRCSRRSANVASLESLGDILSRVASLRALGSVRDLVERRLGLPLGAVSDATLARHGLDRDSRTGESGRARLVALVRELAPEILANAADERRAYREYLRRAGFGGDRDHAVVDLGYSGTLQIALAELTSGDGLHGYYLLTYRAARAALASRGLASNAYVGDYVERDDGQLALARRISVLESLFLGDEDSLVRMRLVDGELVEDALPRDPAESARAAIVATIQAGALDYVRDVTRALAPIPDAIDLAASRASRALDVYFDDPSPIDAAILAPLAFEDHYAAAGVRLLVAPSGEPSLWPEGSRAIAHGDRPSTSVAGALARVDWLGGRADEVARGVSPVVGPWIDALAPRVLSGTKLDKFRREPRRFFADAGGVAVRALGRMYLHHRRRKDRDPT